MTRIVLTGTGLVCPERADGPWFDPVPYLGARGWKYLSPATRYLLAAAGLAVHDAELRPAELPDESMGVVIGTNLAASPVVARLDRTVIAEGSAMLSPAEAPNFSVNIPASHISMRYGMRAFNLTLTNPVVAGVESLVTLAASLRRGRAAAGIAGATEERPDGSPPDGPSSEGACCVVVETEEHALARGARPRAVLVGGFCRFVTPDAPADAWARAVGDPLRALVAALPGPPPYAGPAGGGEFGRLVDACCRDLAGVGPVRGTGLGDDGRHLTVSPLLQLTELLAGDGHGLLVAAGPHGHVAALLFTTA